MSRRLRSDDDGLDPRSVAWAGSLAAANLALHGHWMHRSTMPCDGHCADLYRTHRDAFLAAYPPGERTNEAHRLYEPKRSTNAHE